MTHTWTKLATSTDPDTWHTLAHERFHALVWPFGPIHQAKVLVEYPHAWMQHTCCRGTTSVGIGLPSGKTREESMHTCLEWIDRYREDGPSTLEVEMARCFELYPTLYKTRADVLSDMWFHTGNGYEWLDGAIIYTDQEPPPDTSPLEEANKMDELRQQVWDALPEDARAEHPELLPPDPEPTKRPLPDNNEPRDWGTIRQGSIHDCALLTIPPDLRHEWLSPAREAAKLLQFRSINPDHAELGKRVFADLCPKDLDEAFEALDLMLSHEDCEALQTTDDAERMVAQIHHSLGRHIRNEWGLWHDSPLAQHLEKEHRVAHADDMSGVILRQYIRRRYPTAWDRIMKT